MIHTKLPNRILLFLICNLLVAATASGQCNVAKPKNLHVTSVNSCSINLSWLPANGAAYYQLKYKQGNGPYVYINTGTSISWQITGLAANKKYTVQVASFCANGQTKGYSTQVKSVTLACSPPASPAISNVSKHKAVVKWQPACGGSEFNLQYKALGSPAWTTLASLTDTAVLLTSLDEGTTYEVQVQTICEVPSAFTEPVFFTTTGGTPDDKPNILAIMIDDGRYDIYQPNGGPSWFQSPAINRIADEGVNFKLTCPATSQCAPSRATFYTGLYPHHHGCIVNSDHMNDSLPLIQQILKDHGYYTGFVGKYGQNLGTPQGFNWWAISQSDYYENVVYTINDEDTFITGHISDIYPQLALEFLNQVPEGQPFALFYFHRAPHGPTVPRPEDALLYTSEEIPFPSNFDKYTHDYPSFYYSSVYKWPYDSLETDTAKLLEYQAIAGVEDNVDTLTDWLESQNLIDNTFMLYTSDNGYIKGEHKLQGKGLAQDESIRLPLFIRYPKWFMPGSEVTDEIAANIDIAPTLLELAGIPDTFGMDGVSLRKLYNQNASRKEFFYEFGGTGSLIPPLRSVRSLDYKYTYYYCNSTTEEFFDLVNDPQENNNLIANEAYSAIIQTYREKLDSLRTVYGDYEPVNINCTLLNPTLVKVSDNGNTAESSTAAISVIPNPAAGIAELRFSAFCPPQGELTVMNAVGQVMMKKNITDTSLPLAINCSAWPSGIYQLILQSDDQVFSEKMIVAGR